jgi:hypothetical protein
MEVGPNGAFGVKLPEIIRKLGLGFVTILHQPVVALNVHLDLTQQLKPLKIFLWKLNPGLARFQNVFWVMCNLKPKKKTNFLCLLFKPNVIVCLLQRNNLNLVLESSESVLKEF